MSKGINETAFASQVEDLLKLFNWRWTHFRPARTEKGWRTAMTGSKGFVDYVAVRKGICLFIELKSEKGKLTDEQEEWGKELARVASCSLGVMYYTWRPSQLETEVMEVLRY